MSAEVGECVDEGYFRPRTRLSRERTGQISFYKPLFSLRSFNQLIARMVQGNAGTGPSRVKMEVGIRETETISRLSVIEILQEFGVSLSGTFSRKVFVRMAICPASPVI